MTIGEVRARVEAIRAKAGDYGAQHSMEDQLHQDVLAAIADGAADAADLAREALKTLTMDFERYCA